MGEGQKEKERERDPIAFEHAAVMNEAIDTPAFGFGAQVGQR